MNIDTSLLRERFVIQENTEVLDGSKLLSIQAPSTRMPISLQAGELPPENFVVRSHNMPSCVRMVCKMIDNYERHGPILPRAKSIKWDILWDECLSNYERRFNIGKNRVSVYHQGKTIFSKGEYHGFLDIIEKCDTINKGDYSQSLEMAKGAFLQAGKDVDIHYDSNVALIAIIGKTEGRCSMVLRGAGQTNTFNYTLSPQKSGERINLIQALSSAADFLEGVHLCYLIGMNNEKIQRKIIEKYSEEYHQTQKARDRINSIVANIRSMENRYNVRYRPEKPNFDYLLRLSRKNAKQMSFSSSDDDDDEYIY